MADSEKNPTIPAEEKRDPPQDEPNLTTAQQSPEQPNNQSTTPAPQLSTLQFGIPQTSVQLAPVQYEHVVIDYEEVPVGYTLEYKGCRKIEEGTPEFTQIWNQIMNNELPIKNSTIIPSVAPQPMLASPSQVIAPQPFLATQPFIPQVQQFMPVQPMLAPSQVFPMSYAPQYTYAQPQLPLVAPTTSVIVQQPYLTHSVTTVTNQVIQHVPQPAAYYPTYPTYPQQVLF